MEKGPYWFRSIPDARDLKLAVLGGEHPGGHPTTTAFVPHLLDKAGDAFHTYRNTLLVLAPDAEGFAALGRQIRHLLALKAVREDKELQRTLSREDQQTIQSKLKEAHGGVDFYLLAPHRHLAKAGADGVEWENLGLPTAGERRTLTQRVRGLLKSEESLLERLAPGRVLELGMGKDEPENTQGEICEVFLRYPTYPSWGQGGVVGGGKVGRAGGAVRRPGRGAPLLPGARARGGRGSRGRARAVAATVCNRASDD